LADGGLAALLSTDVVAEFGRDLPVMEVTDEGRLSDAAFEGSMPCSPDQRQSIQLETLSHTRGKVYHV
jgi:hypothetical protein